IRRRTAALALPALGTPSVGEFGQEPAEAVCHARHVGARAPGGTARGKLGEAQVVAQNAREEIHAGSTDHAPRPLLHVGHGVHGIVEPLDEMTLAAQRIDAVAATPIGGRRRRRQPLVGAPEGAAGLVRGLVDTAVRKLHFEHVDVAVDGGEQLLARLERVVDGTGRGAHVRAGRHREAAGGQARAVATVAPGIGAPARGRFVHGVLVLFLSGMTADGAVSRSMPTKALLYSHVKRNLWTLSSFALYWPDAKRFCPAVEEGARFRATDPGAARQRCGGDVPGGVAMGARRDASGDPQHSADRGRPAACRGGTPRAPR